MVRLLGSGPEGRWRARRVVPNVAVLLTFTLLACADSTPEDDRAPDVTRSGATSVRECEAHALSVSEVDTVASRLETPWGLAIRPDGTVLVAQRTGVILALNPTTKRHSEWARVDAASIGELGLFTVALRPDYALSRRVGIAVARAVGSRTIVDRAASRLARALGGEPKPAFAVSVLEYRDEGEVGTPMRTLVKGLPTGVFHAGGGLLWESPSSLLLTLGDGQMPHRAADAFDPRGAILRLSGAPDGERPWTWRVVARGVRNSQALIRLPHSGQVVFLDHGPTGAGNEHGRVGLDEVNALGADGGDFGWPAVAGQPDDETTIAPLHVWPEAVAPAGLAAVPGADSLFTDLLVTTLRGRSLRVVRLRTSAEGATVICESSLLDSLQSRLRALAVRSDSPEVFVGTSNRDGRGWPGPNDDHLLRIRVAAPLRAERNAAQTGADQLPQALP